MTSFKGEPPVDTQDANTANTPPPETQQPKPISRLKANPKMWQEAMRFADMLTYCRPHMSKTEGKFINDYIRPAGIKFDKKGNMYKQIGDAPVLWSSHIDTVHAKKGFQKIEYWIDTVSGDTFLGVANGQKSSCLGADDTSGVWVMLEMIKREVPGLYIFHRGEECGGIGSKWIAENNKEALKDIRFAIAFDRRDTDSIITYQGGTRCCSDEFANSLAEQLGMGHKCDETGAFTDTKSYVDHIAECTNVSAGYYNAHGITEKVNLDYLFKLRDAICQVDVSKLVENRKPGENTRKTYHYTGSRFYDGWGDWDGDHYGFGYGKKKPEGAKTYLELDKEYPKGWLGRYYYDTQTGYYLPCKALTDQSKKKDLGVTKVAPGYKFKSAYGGNKYHGSYDDAVKLIRANPDTVADLLEGLGYGSEEIRDHIREVGGVIFC